MIQNIYGDIGKLKFVLLLSNPGPRDTLTKYENANPIVMIELGGVFPYLDSLEFSEYI